MVDSLIKAVDALNGVSSDLAGAADALCNRASLEDDDLSSMLTHVLDADASIVREVIRWLKAQAETEAGESSLRNR